MNRAAEEVIKKVHDLFKNRRITLSAAESCTGGLISHYITNLRGASDFFRAGIISYSEEVKSDILGVSSETIVNKGVVSNETAKEMAERVRILTKSDFSVSTTGNLGPGVLEGKERGLVYIAAAGREKTVSRVLHLDGNRDENKTEAAIAALRLLIEQVEGETIERD